jgi:hypothetical protein
MMCRLSGLSKLSSGSSSGFIEKASLAQNAVHRVTRASLPSLVAFSSSASMAGVDEVIRSNEDPSP